MRAAENLGRFKSLGGGTGYLHHLADELPARRKAARL